MSKAPASGLTYAAHEAVPGADQKSIVRRTNARTLHQMPTFSTREVAA